MENRYDYVNKPSSAFEARDNWDHEILSMGYKLSPTASSVLQFILSHAMYSGEYYGYLDIRYCSQETIGKINGGRDRKSIGRALKELEDLQLIRRERRFDPNTGNRYEDAIYLLLDHRERGLRYTIHLGYEAEIKRLFPRTEWPRLNELARELGSYEISSEEADDFVRVKILDGVEPMGQNVT